MKFNLNIFIVWCLVHFIAPPLVVVYAETDMIETLDHFIAKLLAGVDLTAGFALSLGTNYPPIDQDVTFWCVLPEQVNLNQTYFNDPDIHQKIDFSRPVNFVIHGWLGGLNGGNKFLPAEVKPDVGWMRSTAINWAYFANSNVCAVDWSRLSNYAYSIAALRHTKMVADCLVYFMVFLRLNGMDITEVSLAGHSLGAQIGGLVGAKFSGVINAIYGLDPAGPGFTFPFDFGASSRLDPTDAQYVQCVYTSRATFGTLKDCGHGNFIINGGFIQNGCLTVFCSHSRSHDFFEEALFPSHQFIGQQCSGSIHLFINNFFGQRCSHMEDFLGIYTQRLSGRFFLNTNPHAPYALNIVS